MVSEKSLYFMSFAKYLSKNARCFSRKIGAVLVKDDEIISYGWNGQPDNLSMCENSCPRKEYKFKSGEGTILCPAIHAEVCAVINAIKEGNPTKGADLYCFCGVPCNSCAAILIQAGIDTIYCTRNSSDYSPISMRMFTEAGVKVVYIDEGDVGEYDENPDSE